MFFCMSSIHIPTNFYALIHVFNSYNLSSLTMQQRLFKNGFLSYARVMSVLLYKYAKCGSLYKEIKFFDKIHNGNRFSWIAMIVGYA